MKITENELNQIKEYHFSIYRLSDKVEAVIQKGRFTIYPVQCNLCHYQDILTMEEMKDHYIECHKS